MKVSLLAVLSGALFGFGLSLSGMLDPLKVLGFLDITGNWDPSLAAVMGGALVPMAIAWRIQAAWAQPLGTAAFQLPKTWPLDVRLILGSACFGIGWACSGWCPGPALVDLVIVPEVAFPYLGAMVLGALLARQLR